MAWLCVSEWGEEIICDTKPIRTYYGEWVAYQSINCEEVNLSMELTKGSIKKLIGKELTWTDEPVEI